MPHLVRRRRPQPHQRRRARGNTQPAQLPLATDLQAQHAIPLDEVQRHLRHGPPRDADLDAGVGDALDDLLHLPLLGPVVVLQVVGVLHEDGALRLGGAGLDAAPEDYDLRVHRGRDRRLEAAERDEAVDHVGLRDVPPEDLGHAHGFDGEGRGPGGGRRHRPEACLGDERGEDVLGSEVLRGQHRPDHPHELLLGPPVCHRPDELRHGGEEVVEQLVARLGISRHHVGGVQSHPEQVHGLR